MKTGVLGALFALSALFSLIGGGSAAFSAEPGNQEMLVLASSETVIDSEHLSSGQGALSSAEGGRTASDVWLFEIISIIFVGIMMLATGRVLRVHRRNLGVKTGELKEMLNGGVSV